MSDTIYEQLAATWPRYHQHDTTPEGTMSLATIEADVRNAVGDIAAKAEEIGSHVKAVLDQHLPKLLDTAQAVEESPLVQAALAAVLPPQVEAEIAALVSKLHDQFNPDQGQPAGPQPEPAPAQPAA